MKMLQHLTNIVPVIGKADMMTSAEKIKYLDQVCIHSMQMFEYLLSTNVFALPPD